MALKSFVTDPTTLGSPIEFELDGETYKFTPTKTDTMFVGLMAGRRSKNVFDNLNAQFAWFANGLDQNHESDDDHDGSVEGCQACRIFTRLQDPKDALTLKTVNDVIDWLLGEVSGRPTT
jgi:hypothetical protein